MLQPFIDGTKHITLGIFYWYQTVPVKLKSLKKKIWVLKTLKINIFKFRLMYINLKVAYK